MSESVSQMKDYLKGMGLDIDKIPRDKMNAIVKLAESISDPANMDTEQVLKLQQLLGVRRENGTFGTVKRVPRKRTKIGNNEKCPCKSGKKYKKCCLQKKVNG